MISFLMLRAGFPVMFVPVAVITLPFLLGLLAKDVIVAIFALLNSLLRGFWGFFESFMPVDWFFGKVTDQGNGSFYYEDPTTFNKFWTFFADFRFPEHDGSVPIIIWFMIFVAIVEFFVLIKLLKRAARQGQMPDPMSDLKGLEAMKGRRYDD